jgi:hypothetical protein
MSGCNALHSGQKVLDGIHIPYAFEFINETQMNSAVVTVDDIGKFANVDGNKIYMLVNATPTWVLIGPSSLDGYVTMTELVTILDGYATEAQLQVLVNEEIAEAIQDSETFQSIFTALDGYLTPTDHRDLDQLVHAIAETSYEEVTYSGGNATALIIWTNSGKTLKIREELYTYGSGNHISTIVTHQYNSVGSIVETLTENYTWSGGQVINITRTLT